MPRSAGLRPALLVVARLLQGLSLGGEYGASATYLSEMAGERRRGFFSSFQYVTLISGQLVASAVLLVLQLCAQRGRCSHAWGWRIPFAIGAVLAVVVFWIRRRLAETESFANAKAAGAPRSSGWRLFAEHPQEALLVMALTAGGTLAFYAYTIYMQKFLVNTSGFDLVTGNRIATAALLRLHVPAAARRRLVGPDRAQADHGRLRRARADLHRPDLHIAGDAPAIPMPPSRWCSRRLVIVTGYTSINAVVKAELFPAHIRALGVALPYALANTIFGGTAEYVALRLKAGDLESVFYWYVAGDDRPVADRLRQDARHQAPQPDRGGLAALRSCNTCRIRPGSAWFPSAAALPTSAPYRRRSGRR